MLRQLRRDQGQDLVEYALVLPILAALLFGIVEMVLVMFAYNTIADAAREGARYGVIHPTDSSGINTAARKWAIGLDPADLTVKSSAPGGGLPSLGGNFIRVAVTYRARFITTLLSPAFGGKPYVDLQAVSTMQIE